MTTDVDGGERPRCPRDTDWCDGVICRERGIACANAECFECEYPLRDCVCEDALRCSCGRPVEVCVCAGRVPS